MRREPEEAGKHLKIVYLGKYFRGRVLAAGILIQARREYESIFSSAILTRSADGFSFFFSGIF